MASKHQRVVGFGTGPTSLFDAAGAAELDRHGPLAARLRPRGFDDLVGQPHLFGVGAPLRVLVEGGHLHSAVLFGPPGTGKTSFARLLAGIDNRHYVELSAVSAGVREVREVHEAARQRLGAEGRGTVVFLDEVHRFSKAQQDALLPGVEEGAFVLVGATTENPFYFLAAPLLSRSTLWRFTALSRDALTQLVRRGLEVEGATADEEALAIVVDLAEGDARAALTTLEVALDLARCAPAPMGGDHDGQPRLEAVHVKAARTTRALRYSVDGHYDLASALIKSVRGSDPDAGCYWLARMLAVGEDPRFIARRLVVLASEDIGQADPLSLLVADAAARAVELVGLPEARLNLAQAVIHLSLAPKSNASAVACSLAEADVASAPAAGVPASLRDPHSAGGAGAAGGSGSDDRRVRYVSPHDDPAAASRQSYLPPELEGRVYYEPLLSGREAAIAERRRAGQASIGGASSHENARD